MRRPAGHGSASRGSASCGWSRSRPLLSQCPRSHNNNKNLTNFLLKYLLNRSCSVVSFRTCGTAVVTGREGRLEVIQLLETLVTTTDQGEQDYDVNVAC
jgi:hypothetical protein